MTNPPRAFFDRRAAAYQQQSTTHGLWTLLRRREERALLELLDPRPGESILDAGAGAGYYSGLLHARGARVTALDVSEPMLAALRTRLAIPTIHADLETLESDQRFDRILCAGALEFLQEPAHAIARLLALLDPAGPGVLVVMAPRRCGPALMYRLYHRSHGVTVRLFDLESLSEAAARAPGFRVDASRTPTFNLAARFIRTAP